MMSGLPITRRTLFGAWLPISLRSTSPISNCAISMKPPGPVAASTIRFRSADVRAVHNISGKCGHIGMAHGGSDPREDRVEWLPGDDSGSFNGDPLNADAIDVTHGYLQGKDGSSSSSRVLVWRFVSVGQRL